MESIPVSDDSEIVKKPTSLGDMSTTKPGA